MKACSEDGFSSGARPTGHACGGTNHHTGMPEMPSYPNGLLLGCSGTNLSGMGTKLFDCHLVWSKKGSDFSQVTACAIFSQFYSILFAFPQSGS